MGKRVRVGMIATIVVLVGFGVAAAADRFEDEFTGRRSPSGCSSRRPAAATSWSAPKS